MKAFNLQWDNSKSYITAIIRFKSQASKRLMYIDIVWKRNFARRVIYVDKSIKKSIGKCTLRDDWSYWKSSSGFKAWKRVVVIAKRLTWITMRFAVNGAAASLYLLSYNYDDRANQISAINNRNKLIYSSRRRVYRVEAIFVEITSYPKTSVLLNNN